jgi:hypothetical protein
VGPCVFIILGAVRVLGGPYLDKHNIMVEHYGVISKISKEGYEIISDAAKEKLAKDFAEGLSFFIVNCVFPNISRC